MLLDDFLADYLDDEAFGETNATFWVRAVIEAMAFLEPETDANLERLSRLLLDYYNGAQVDRATIKALKALRREALGSPPNESSEAEPPATPNKAYSQ